MNSKFFNLNIKDLLHGLVIVFVSSLIASIGQFLEAWSVSATPGLAFDKISFILSLKAAFAASAAYLLKKLFTNSRGFILQNEN